MRLFGCAFLLAFMTALSRPQAHGAAGWIMADPQTMHCCGPQDCRQLADGEARFDSGVWRVNGRVVPAGSVYPTGPAGGSRYWACFQVPALVEPRCLFIPALF